MTKKLSFIIAMLSVVFTLSAKRISETVAYSKATKFMPETGQYMSRSGSSVTLAHKDANYYVYNYPNGGFVIVSGSDLTDEILGYSKTGTFNKKDIPENMKSFLQSYSDEIDYAEKNNINGKSVKSRSSDSKTNIEPLIKSKWDQGYPYNLYCPEINGQKTLTGCVATAMAQIVAYHKSKTNPSGFHTYNNREINLDTCTINYENLCITYTGNETKEQIHEIAKLMKVCGYTVDMSYGINASSTNTANIKTALINYFDYSNDAKWICRHTYNNQDEWEDDIYNSLKNSNPVPYRAKKANREGHAFVCDGYENGYYHINWGWGGFCDGYFKLSALYVNGEDYTSKIYGENDYMGVHCAIINLHPNVLNTNKNSDSINPNTTYTVNESNIVIEYINNSLYTGSVKYGLLAVNEQNDTTALSTKQEMIESEKSIIESVSISELNLNEGLTTLIPVIYYNDTIKRISEKDIYVACT
ncbi:MAG: C10 family peptidase, partial [Muribaculaceae bacterium]|nr:C10 family peptidase [Muribaculaceae bacterium]